MDAILTGRGCTNSWHCRGNPVNDEDGPRRPLRTTSTTSVAGHAPVASSSCKTLDGMLCWLRDGVADAFFASLQRFSCINIETRDDNNDDYTNNSLMGANDHHNLSGDEVLFEVDISQETT